VVMVESHCLLQLDVSDDSGHVAHWIAETENPSTLTRIGWTEKSLKPGDQITLTALPVKTGNLLDASSTSCSRVAKG